MKIRRWHDEKEPGDPVHNAMDCFKLMSVLVQRLNVLRAIDPDFSRSVVQILTELQEVAKEYYQMVIWGAVTGKHRHS
jgi:hypothetical protein